MKGPFGLLLCNWSSILSLLQHIKKRAVRWLVYWIDIHIMTVIIFIFLPPMLAVQCKKDRMWCNVVLVKKKKPHWWDWNTLVATRYCYQRFGGELLLLSFLIGPKRIGPRTYLTLKTKYILQDTSYEYSHTDPFNGTNHSCQQIF